MTTIKDIASRLGVAVSTVSKGLNGASDISEELRKLILDTAVEMGYQNKKAHKEGNKKLAIFVENMDFTLNGDFGYEIILGFQQMAYRDHYSVDVVAINRDFMLEEKYDSYMLKKGYSGALILGLALRDPWNKDLARTSVPTALLDNSIENRNVCYIGTDNYEALRTAVEHLVTNGHRKIAFLNGSEHSFVSEERMQAYEQAILRNRMELHEDLYCYGYYSAEAAPQYVPTFLKNGATAIICGNDQIAKGVIDYVQSVGLRVPEDISVIGFDDIPMAESMHLTTIRQDRLALGRCAYFEVCSLMNNIAVSRTTLRPKLMERSTVAEVKSR